MTDLFIDTVRRLTGEGLLSEAEAAVRDILARDPGSRDARTNLARLLMWMERYDDSATLFEELLTEDPENTDIAGRLSMVCLAQGKLEKGWRLYESGLVDGTRHEPVRFACPRWDGRPLSDGTLLIWREQGLGDELRFASCYAEALSRVKRCVITADPRLIPLFRSTFPGADIRAADTVDPLDRSFAAQVPAGSLPMLLRPTLESFPNRSGYLRARPDRVAYWRGKLTNLGPGTKVGFSWRGKQSQIEKRQHVTGLDDWGPLLATPGARFVNLQYDATADELADFEARTGHRIDTLEGLDLKTDLDDLAAVITALGLTVSVGNSTANLVGALGMPCWEPLAAWHPDMLGAGRLPWYPETRVFAKSWDTPWPTLIAEMAAELEAHVARLIPRNAPCPCGSGKRYKHCCGRTAA